MNPTILSTAETRYTAEIVINDVPMNWLATAIDNAISDTSFRQPTPVDIEAGKVHIQNFHDAFIAAAEVAIGARVYQVAQLPTRFDKKNFEYVALLGPIMGMYGVYHDANEAYDIVPALPKKLKTKLEDMGVIVNGVFTVPEWYQEVMYLFRRHHLMTGYGLPKDVSVSEPTCFKISLEGENIVGKPGATVREVLIASLVYSSKLTDLFGAYRTLYSGIGALRTTIENIGLKALHNLN
jgi:hypothetical protein